MTIVLIAIRILEIDFLFIGASLLRSECNPDLRDLQWRVDSLFVSCPFPGKLRGIRFLGAGSRFLSFICDEGPVLYSQPCIGRRARGGDLFWCL